MSQLDASLIVCTRNRSTILAEACDAILAIDHPPERWEVVIVDNDSTDDTWDIAKDVEKRYPNRVRVLRETQLGLSAARNAGIRATDAPLVAFVDDDAYPEPSWLRAVSDALAREGVLAAGGPVDPRFTGPLPDWLTERYLPYLSAWDLGPELVELRYNEFPRGTNMAFRREVFERFGLFSTRLGRTGTSLLSCEETELCLRIERGGGKIVYVPEARVGHRVDASRLTHEWLVERFGAQGRSEAIVDWMHAGIEGLERGLRRMERFAEQGAAETGEGSELVAQCHQRSAEAYLRSARKCPFTVPRWIPGPQAGDVAGWLPFE